MVTVFEGQLTRTWYFQTDARRHILSMYHDTITGIRSCTVNFEDVPGSYGNSSMLMDSAGHRMFFTITEHKDGHNGGSTISGGNQQYHNPNHYNAGASSAASADGRRTFQGYFQIKRSGWVGFDYACVVDDQVLTETTHEVPQHQDPIYSTKVMDTCFIEDEYNPEDQIAWYRVVTTRLTDKVTTSVHRRFKEFADLNSQIKQNFKGHHLRSSIPEFPDKTLKLMADHRDPAFIQERISKLERYLVNLVALPHVNDMTCIKAFLGLMEQVKEISYVFHVPTLGLTLLPTNRQGTPCVVGNIQKSLDRNEGGSIQVGDVVSKVNGIPVADTSFDGVVCRVKRLPRPLLVHLIQILGAGSPEQALAAVGAVTSRTAASSSPQASSQVQAQAQQGASGFESSAPIYFDEDEDDGGTGIFTGSSSSSGDPFGMSAAPARAPAPAAAPVRAPGALNAAQRNRLANTQAAAGVSGRAAAASTSPAPTAATPLAPSKATKSLLDDLMSTPSAASSGAGASAGTGGSRGQSPKPTKSAAPKAAAPKPPAPAPAPKVLKGEHGEEEGAFSLPPDLAAKYQSKKAASPAAPTPVVAAAAAASASASASAAAAASPPVVVNEIDVSPSADDYSAPDPSDAMAAVSLDDPTQQQEEEQHEQQQEAAAPAAEAEEEEPEPEPEEEAAAPVAEILGW